MKTDPHLTVSFNSTPNRRGFSLMEVLLAMAIFGVGFAAIAAVFPVATVMQKQAYEDTLSRQAVPGITAMVQARPYQVTDLDNTNFKFPSGTGLASPMGMEDESDYSQIDANSDGYPDSNDLWDHFPLADRSFPSHVGWEQRHIYWVPLARRTTATATEPNEWEVYVFILSSQGYGDYSQAKTETIWANRGDPPSVPGVAKITAVTVTGGDRFEFDNQLWSQTPANVADQIRPGDQVIDSNGQIYTVRGADPDGIQVDRDIESIPAAPTELWYGRPPGPDRPSPTLQIIGPIYGGVTS